MNTYSHSAVKSSAADFQCAVGDMSCNMNQSEMFSSDQRWFCEARQHPVERKEQRLPPRRRPPNTTLLFRFLFRAESGAAAAEPSGRISSRCVIDGISGR